MSMFQSSHRLQLK